MFSLLDMVNHYLGYVNLNVKLKNRIYTILGTLGDIYLFYVAIRWIQNGYALRGSLILLVAILLLYFTVMNIFYYFTEKQPPLDISPKIEKALGKTLGGADPAAEAAKKAAAEAQGNQSSLLNGANIPANGFFDAKKILPGKVTVDINQRQNITQLANRLQQMNLMTPDYGGLGQREIEMQLKQAHKPVFAIGLGVNIPYFELQHVGDDLIVYAGINQAEKASVGKIITVGLQPIADVADKVKLYLANVILVGGPYMEMGRNLPMEKPAPYAIRVQLAYERQEDRQNGLASTTSTSLTREMTRENAMHEAPLTSGLTREEPKSDATVSGSRMKRYH